MMFGGDVQIQTSSKPRASMIDDDEHLVFAVANGGGKTQCQVLILGPQLHYHFLTLAAL